MNENDTEMETALLEIAKDLLQASDDLAALDPPASAKLAQEAYEIGRDLGIVRNHLDSTDRSGLAAAFEASSRTGGTTAESVVEVAGDGDVDGPEVNGRVHRRETDDEVEDGLSRILDRQRAILPEPVDLAPVRKPSRNGKPLTFDSARKRSGWFGWMRGREWRHAG